MSGKGMSPGSNLASIDNQGGMLFITPRPPLTPPQWAEGRIPCYFRVRVLVCAPYVVSIDTMKGEGSPENKLK